MSDNEKPLDIAGIEARLTTISLDAEWLEVVKSKPRHLLVYTDEDEVFELPKEFIANAPTDIAALLGEVHRLRLEVNKMARAGYDFDVWETGRTTRGFTPPYLDEVEQ